MRTSRRGVPLLALTAAVLATLGSTPLRAQGLPATLLRPSSGAVGVSTTFTFTWTAVAGAQAYELYVGTLPGAYDLADSGPIQQTSYLVGNLLASRQLYARIWTRQPDGWTFSEIGFQTAAVDVRAVAPIERNRVPHTLVPDRSEAADLARPVFPADGAQSVDAALPFEWTQVAGATYRLTVGSRAGGSDLHDSGEIRFPKHFAQGLPERQALYATLWTNLNGSWKSTDFSFTLGPPSSPLDAKINAAFWATDFVRQMADARNAPFPGTPLAALLAREGYSNAFCSDYAAILEAALRDMDDGLRTRVLNLFMNTNLNDAHTLVELFHPVQNEWILLDPTFNMTVRRASDGLWATAEDMTRATLAQQWDDIVYVPLGSEGFEHARSYYIDYPLLYLNPSLGGFVPGKGNSPLPYYEELSEPPVGATDIYAVRAPDFPYVHIIVNGVRSYFACDGIDGLSYAFGASTIEPDTDTPPSLTIYRLRRFVF